MTTVLGIDAAWTSKAASGVALLTVGPNGPRLRLTAPSYEEFMNATKGGAINWKRPRSGTFHPKELLAAAETVSGTSVEIVAIDMPISTAPIFGRREADNAISRAFGAALCGTHSPNSLRPGVIGSSISAAFQERGYTLVGSGASCGMKPALVEVYPHVSLLTLSGSRTRLPYKAAKTTGYWPNTARDERKRRVRDQWQFILDKLGNDIDGIPQVFDISTAFEGTTLNALKPFEDALDAVICAWTGYRYSIGRARPYGDATAAIWVPTS